VFRLSLLSHSALRYAKIRIRILENIADTVVVLDFETTGLSPNYGDRAIEIGAVLLKNGTIVDRFQKLMNPGVLINSFIENYTGITNKMLKDQPSCEDVMVEFTEFIGDYNLIAHNASFDKRFLDSEFQKINKSYNGSFCCSMLVARRIYQDAPNHKLETLISHTNIKPIGSFHRALADAEMTAYLWTSIIDNINERYRIPVIYFDHLKKLSKTDKAYAHKYLCSLVK